MTTNPERLADLFEELRPLAMDARVARLTDLRESDSALADQLQSLLEAYDAAEGFLDSLDTARAAELLQEDDRNAVPEEVGPFRLVDELGRGGLGVVYLGERADGAFDQQVAIKLIKRGMDSDSIVRRFRAERRILGALDHPSISRIVDGGVLLDGRPWFAMEYIRGESINSWCDRRGVGVRARLALFETVCRAVQFAHSRLIVHRDLKPANIHVTTEGKVKLLDFGIAKLLNESDEVGSDPTLAGLRAMTLAYAAPEQIRGEPVSVVTDVYALGVVLYELLCGVHPYRRRGLTREALNQAICSGDAALPSIAGGDQRLRGDLDAIVMKAMASDAEDRYGSAESLAEDLRRHLDDQPISARHKTTAYRVGRFLRRHRLGVAATSAVVLALSIGLVLAAWQARVAAKEAESARLNAQRAAQETVRSERTLDFLTDLFRSGDPRQGQMVESIDALLSAGEARARSDLVEDSSLQNRVLLRLARVRLNRTESKLALAIAREVIARLEAETGASTELLAEAYDIAGSSLYQLDEDATAEQRIRQAISLFRSLGDDIRADRSTSVLAGISRRTRDFPQAVELQRGLVARSTERVGPDSLETLQHRFSLGIFAIDLGDYELAERELRAALAGFERSPEESAASRATITMRLGSLLDRTGRSDEAGPYFARAIAILRDLYGPQSLPVAEALFAQGIFFLGQDELGAAETAFRSVIEAEGSAPYLRAHGWRYLGRALREQSRYGEALEKLLQAEDAYRAIGGQSLLLQAHRAAADRGHTLTLMGDAERGVAILRSAINGIESIRGETHYDLIQPLGYYGHALDQAQRANARAVLQRALQVADEILGPDHRFTHQAQQRLAELNPD